MSETAQERAVRHGKEFYNADRYRADDWAVTHPAIRERICDDAEELYERWRGEVLAEVRAAVESLRDEPSITWTDAQKVLAALDALRGEGVVTEARPSHGAVLWEAMQAASPLIAREPNWEDQPTANQVYLNQLADAVAAAVMDGVYQRINQLAVTREPADEGYERALNDLIHALSDLVPEQEDRDA